MFCDPRTDISERKLSIGVDTKNEYPPLLFSGTLYAPDENQKYLFMCPRYYFRMDTIQIITPNAVTCVAA